MSETTTMSLDEAILHCQQIIERFKKETPGCACQLEHTQLLCWLTELKRLRSEVAGMRSNWYKCAESLRTIRAERDAAVADLKRLVPAWKYDDRKSAGSMDDASDKQQPTTNEIRDRIVSYKYDEHMTAESAFAEKYIEFG